MWVVICIYKYASCGALVVVTIAVHQILTENAFLCSWRQWLYQIVIVHEAIVRTVGLLVSVSA